MIDWIGDDAAVAMPASAQIIDVNGKAVLPGWVMLHEHLYMSALTPASVVIKEMPVSFPRHSRPA